MMRKIFLTIFILIFCWITEVNLVVLKGSVRNSEPSNTSASAAFQVLYQQLSSNQKMTLPGAEVLSVALKGFNNLKTVPGAIKKDILTVIDFSLP